MPREIWNAVCLSIIFYWITPNLQNIEDGPLHIIGVTVNVCDMEAFFICFLSRAIR